MYIKLVKLKVSIKIGRQDALGWICLKSLTALFYNLNALSACGEFPQLTLTI